MTKQDRYRYFVEYFSKHQPDAVTELHYSTPYELLVAVILSAQCTDKRINQVTPALFKRFPTPEALAASSPAKRRAPNSSSLAHIARPVHLRGPDSKMRYLPHQLVL